MRKPALIASVLLALGSSVALAQNEPGTAASQPQEPGKIKQAVTRIMLTNDSFVEKAAMSNLAEIEAAKLALSKSQDPQIRSFAQRMITDHTSATNQLKGVAQSKQIAVPAVLDSTHVKALDKLNGMSGADFDAAFTLQMQEDHEKAVLLFAAATEDKSLDADLQALARKVLPTLRSHQAEAGKLPHSHADAKH
jgi:putative membrane protein